jgi:CheY-like chemotaxis protein
MCAALPNPDPNITGISRIATDEIKALAQVTAQLAPPLNELLATIVGRAKQVLDSAAVVGEDRDALRDLYTAAERAVGVIRQLRTFAGLQPLQVEVRNLNLLVEELTATLRNSISNSIELEVRLGSNLPNVTVDAALVEQVLLGLVWNACDAMPAGGRIVVSTASLVVTPHDRKAFPDGRPGSFVTLGVSDSGTGINPEVLPRIFEPFFTTHDSRRHLGLGLAAILGIVQRHEGWITVDTRPQGGSTFTVFLPAALAGVTPATPERMQRGDRGAGETVLLIDDEPIVREFTAAILTDLGYRVLQAASAEDAEAAWKWQQSRIALLMTDVVLAGSISGLELANRFHSEKPALAVILVSGHGREILRGSVPTPGTYQFLQKPWRPQTLAQMIRALLDSHLP